jgi:murein DD-endopeptidase MepM/ murein hydrolase activator NlpD
VAVILTIASLLSWLPGIPARGAVAGAIGGPTEAHSLTPIQPLAARSTPSGAPLDGAQLRTTDAGQRAPAEDVETGSAPSPTAARATDPVEGPPNRDLTRIDPDAIAAARAPASDAPVVGGPFEADGTLVKPIAVDTSVPDGRHLIKIHRIAKGDSLPIIAERYNISMMTIWWANDLSSQNLVIGKTLAIPTVDGLVVTTREGDTLAGLAKEHDIDVEPIEKVNELDDPVLVPGQTLILPGAAGDPIPEPEPPPATVSRPSAPGGSRGPVVKAPATYSGGGMVWPVVGGNNSVSRGFSSGHYGLDIQGDHGARVVAAAGGTVTFAGWKSNGGGYQVWIAHGSGLYTTYNHLSAVSVGRGQGVGGGQIIGRLGNSGNSTGPHLHFEVWVGEIWSGGNRVNPLSRL